MILEVNCETDFVARSDKFQELVEDLSMEVLSPLRLHAFASANFRLQHARRRPDTAMLSVQGYMLVSSLKVLEEPCIAMHEPICDDSSMRN